MRFSPVKPGSLLALRPHIPSPVDSTTPGSLGPAGAGAGQPANIFHGTAVTAKGSLAPAPRACKQNCLDSTEGHK
jgi:hypothetical protein